MSQYTNSQGRQFFLVAGHGGVKRNETLNPTFIQAALWWTTSARDTSPETDSEVNSSGNGSCKD